MNIGMFFKRHFCSTYQEPYIFFSYTLIQSLIFQETILKELTRDKGKDWHKHIFTVWFIVTTILQIRKKVESNYKQIIR